MTPTTPNDVAQKCAQSRAQHPPAAEFCVLRPQRHSNKSMCGKRSDAPEEVGALVPLDLQENEHLFLIAPLAEGLG